MTNRQTAFLAVLVAALFAYAVSDIFQLKPNWESILASSNPRSAGIGLSNPNWKTALLNMPDGPMTFMLVWLMSVVPSYKGLRFLFPAPPPDSPFAPLQAAPEYEGIALLPFVGRDDEWRKLDAFVSSAGRLRWWVLRGEPGVGKTRLLREWAHSLKGWELKSLDKNPDRAALRRHWPRRRCLIVVEEYATRLDDIKRLAEALPRRGKPLRLLLVDWATPAAPVPLPPTDCAGEPLVCADWDSGQFHALLPRLWPKDQPPPDEAEAGRLFALSAGNPLALGLSLARPDWAARQRRGLFQHWARELRGRLAQKGLPQDCLPALALASWCGGYPWASCDDCLPGYPPPAPARLSRTAFNAVHAPDRDHIPPLAPETLALEFALAELADNPGQAYRQWLRRLAWHGNPPGTARSLWRLHRLALQGGLDEGERETLAFLDANPADIGCADALPVWQQLQADLRAEASLREESARELRGAINNHGKRGELEAMAASFQTLRELAEDWPGDQMLQQDLAKALVNLAAFYGDAGSLALMAAALDELRGLADAQPGAADIQLKLAQGLYNAAAYYGKHGDWPALAAALDELRQLADAQPGAADIQLHLAMGLVNATNDYGKHGDWPALAAALDELRCLADAHPGAADIQLLLAMGLYNAATAYSRHSDWPALAAALDGLRRLADAHPGAADIQSHLARGLANATNAYGEHGDWPALVAALDELRRLADAQPGAADIQLSLAMGLYNAARAYGGHGDWAALATALDVLRRLADAQPGAADIQLHLASGLFNAATTYGEHGDWPALATALDELRRLADRHPGMADIQLQLAKGLHNATSDYGEHGAWPALAAALDELRRLADAHPGAADIQLHLAMGLFNAANGYGRYGDLSAMTTALKELRRLADAYPDMADIHWRLAQGLNNQTIVDPEHKPAAIAELKTLARRFPLHTGIQEDAHRHGVSHIQQELAKQRDLERQLQAALNARR